MTPKKISRRDFLRLAGLASVSISANNLTPRAKPEHSNFIDKAGRPPRPWWVRTVDEPTIEIDWDQKKRPSSQIAVLPTGENFADFVEEEQANFILEAGINKRQERIEDDTPGYSLKDYALTSAQQIGSRLEHSSFLGPQMAPTPRERGVDIWRGSPDDAARIVRAALRQFGAAQTAFVELNERTRKFIFTVDRDGKEIVFEEVEQAYETESKRVIPNKAKWVIIFLVQMSTETMKRAPTQLAFQHVMLSYTRGKFIKTRAQEFIHGLGYQCLSQDWINGMGSPLPFAVLSGLGEMSRLNKLITPEYGPMVRVFFMITDLPVAIDKPIDAGIMEFCKHCKKCAESCPAGALSLADEPTWEPMGSWNNPGHKAYFEDAVKCFTYWKSEADTDCGICLAVCPFSKKDKAWIHQWVKAGVSALPALDGFFRSMDDAFSYGAQKDPELWWHLNLPEFGIDTE